MYNTNSMTATGIVEINTQVAKMPEVQGEVERLGYGLEVLQKLVDQLSARLSPILAQREVSNASGPSQPEPVRVPLADTLHQRVLVIDDLCAQLRSICERVEV